MNKYNKEIKIDLNNNYLFNCDNKDFLMDFKSQLLGKIDIISIDPPYNTGKQMGKYNDNFKNMEGWIEFMRPRIDKKCNYRCNFR